MQAAAVAAESVLISAFYIYYRDSSPMVYSVAMAIMAAFVSYGRFALKPPPHCIFPRERCQPFLNGVRPEV
jgi:hypothetical protein